MTSRTGFVCWCAAVYARGAWIGCATATKNGGRGVARFEAFAVAARAEVKERKCLERRAGCGLVSRAEEVTGLYHKKTSRQTMELDQQPGTRQIVVFLIKGPPAAQHHRLSTRFFRRVSSKTLAANGREQSVSGSGANRCLLQVNHSQRQHHLRDNSADGAVNPLTLFWRRF